MVQQTERAREILARLEEIDGNKAGAFTLRTEGAVGSVFEAKLAVVLEALSPPPSEEFAEAVARAPFQERVGDWMQACFTPEIIADKLERADRFIEESLELVQATGYSAERAHALVDYVFNRPVGEPFQEVGGVTVTLAALCNPHGINVEEAAEAELARVWTKIEKIRAKQATKPVGSSLPVPIAAMHSIPQESDAEVTEAIRDEIIAAYEQGALDVHNAWIESLGEENAPSRDPDFTEAAHDYASARDRRG